MGEYKDTLNLPKTNLPMRANLAQREPEILKFWDEINIYGLSLKKNKNNPSFILHDGPPYPNGNIHVGHALNKILKDIVVKYKTMKGFYTPFIPGWDCHGLPIETQLLKEMKKKKEVVSSQDNFRERCKSYALHYVNLQKAQFKKLGVRADWENPYLTLSDEYETNVYKAFDVLYKNGYIYKGRKPIHWCYQCKTALAEAEIEYQDEKSPSIYVAFSIEQEFFGFDKLNLIVWTTTPWTLPANVAVAVHPDFNYAIVAAQGKHWILVEDLVETVMEKVAFNDYKIEKILKGSELEGIASNHPFYDRKSPVVLADYVTADDGSGCVHIAPGHGQEDYLIGQKYKLPILMPVNDSGVLTDEAGQFAGLHVNKANKAIVAHMEETGVLLKLDFFNHSYPHCWRCHKPVIFRATDQWFISIDHKDLRQRALAAINKTDWVPAWGIKRITGMVENRPDWCISRQRLWGMKIPIESVSDIMDVWLESGASWATLLGDKQADLYLEGSDQHRGWFQSSLLLSVAIHNRAPYKKVLTHGFTVDDSGKKMSKSSGNVVDPLKVINQYGADILRLWVVSSQFKDDISISDKLIKQVIDVFGKIRNTWRFLLSNLHDYKSEVEQLTELDLWIIMRLQGLVQLTEDAYESYDYHKIYHAVHDFCANDLSSFYLDMIKDRLYCAAKDSIERKSSQTALFIILHTLIRLMAPILTFTTEDLWHHLKDLSIDDSKIFDQQSIQLTKFPVVEAGYIDNVLQEKWDNIFNLRSEVYKKIEIARQKKLISSSLDAKVILVLPNNLDLKEDKLAEIFIVSQVEIKTGDVLEINVIHATGDKCERCWKWADLEDGLCPRCKEVVASIQQ